MKNIKFIATTIVLIITVGFSNLYAQQVQVQTEETFSCSSQTECKAKCEALPGRHVWKPSKSDFTLGTCTKVGKAIVTTTNPANYIIIGVIIGLLSFGGFTLIRRKNVASIS